jgi:hypothetical protein
MINIEQITARLAKLPDQALQQYAMMHKEDPYIMALAVSESNRRKQLRASAQAQPMEQPKVADQALMDMAPQQAAQSPDEAGIAGLAAGDMNFADGGIVAFADGGDVERYQSAGLVRLPNEDFASFRRRMFAAELQAQRDKNAAETASREAERQKLLAGRGEANMVPPSPFFERAPLVPPSGSLFSPPTTPVPDAESIRKVSSSPYVPSGAPTDETAALLQRYPKPGEAAGLGGTKEAAALRPAKAPGTARLDTGLGVAATGKGDDYATMDPEAMFSAAMKKAALEPHPQANELKELGDARVKAKQEEVTGLEAIQKQFNDIYKGRKGRLDAKETEIAKMGDQNLGLALLQAGAAMMSTPGGVGMAIGKGVDVGSKGYASGLERINAAKDKLSDARDRLEEIEAQRGELSARELFKARNEVKTTELSAKEDLIKANMDMFKVNRETATKMVESRLTVAKTVYEQNQQNVRAKLQADTTLAAASMKDARAGAGAESKEVAAAEAAFARDPQAKALAKSLEMLAFDPTSPKYKAAVRQLQEIQASKYRQFGATLEGAPGAPSPGGTTRMRFDAQGNPIK